MASQLFIADWSNVLFMHFRVAASALREQIPLTLDLVGGDAYVSLVAFTQERLRPSVGGRIARLLAAPLARHEFFNVRTYVRAADGTPGIYFLAEWIPNRLAAWIGPRMYGLPYHLGRLRYENDWRHAPMHGTIAAAGRKVSYRATARSNDFAAAAAGTLDHFLLERYVAFTHRAGVVRRFDVAHAPWPQTRANVEIFDASLLALSGQWFNHAELVSANYSPGVRGVAISAPAVAAAPRRRSPSTRSIASPSRSAAPACYIR